MFTLQRMRRRTRIFAFFALAAMTGALAEGVLASTCAPGMDMGGDAMSMDAEIRHDGDGTGASADPGERQDVPADGSDCPFAPVAAQGCLAMASIPATGAAIAASAGDGRERPVIDDERHDLLLRSALFHPPRP
jgi:hypothetical protein